MSLDLLTSIHTLKPKHLVIMKQLTLIIILIALTGSLKIFAQDKILKEEIEKVKRDAFAQGYSIVDEDGSETRSDWGIAFDHEIFEGGYSYIAVAFVQECYSCDLIMQYWDINSETRNYLNPQIETIDGYLMAKWMGNQKYDARIRFDVYVDSEYDHYTYAILFRKKTY